MSQPPSRRPRSAGQGTQGTQNSSIPPRRPATGPAQRGGLYDGPPQRSPRDPFPIIMGVLSVVIVVLTIVLIVLLTRNNSSTDIAADLSVPETSGTANPGGQSATPSETPPRISVDDFMKLYDNPSARPMIIDVRPEAAFEQGHIAGAVSIPYDAIDANIDLIPSDSLVVAYCQ